MGSRWPLLFADLQLEVVVYAGTPQPRTNAGGSDKADFCGKTKNDFCKWLSLLWKEQPLLKKKRSALFKRGEPPIVQEILVGNVTSTPGNNFCLSTLICVDVNFPVQGLIDSGAEQILISLNIVQLKLSTVPLNQPVNIAGLTGKTISSVSHRSPSGPLWKLSLEMWIFHFWFSTSTAHFRLPLARKALSSNKLGRQSNRKMGGRHLFGFMFTVNSISWVFVSPCLQRDYSI